MPDYSLTVRSGHPDFLELPWEDSILDWDAGLFVDLPKGISRHEVRFIRYPQGIYAIKELPTRPAENDYRVLRMLEEAAAPSVTPVGLVEHRSDDPTEERSAALLTKYVDFSFSYRELLQGAGFGERRRQMLGAFAGLLVELHLAGCFWGDCSLSNTLYRYDAMAIEAIMVDAETASMHDELSAGQRAEDIEIMTVNVAGGMADIAASHGIELDDADLDLGEQIGEWYEWLWDQATHIDVIAADEHFRITDRIRRLNELGFTVEEIDLTPADGGQALRLRPVVGGRRFHADRLRELTGVGASEWQARQILTDVFHFQALSGGGTSESGKAVSSIQWRVGVFEPMLARMRELNPSGDPVQGFCDFLHFRYVISADAGYDIGNEAAFATWLEAGRPGFPIEDGPLPMAGP